MYARADEEPVDPKRELEDRCKAPCMRPLKEYQVIFGIRIYIYISQPFSACLLDNLYYI